MKKDEKALYDWLKTVAKACENTMQELEAKETPEKAPEATENAGMSEEELETLERGDYVLYTCGERLEVGRVKSIFPGGAFVYYHDGDTAARTPRSHLRKIANGWTIPYLGGDAFATDRNCGNCKYFCICSNSAGFTADASECDKYTEEK